MAGPWFARRGERAQHAGIAAVQIGAERDAAGAVPQRAVEAQRVVSGAAIDKVGASSAPEEVVDEAKANLSAREDEAAKLHAALTRLAEIG